MIKVAIVGGTGYTGVELLRLLALHPHAQVEVITSRSEEGVRVADMYPNLREAYPELAFSVPQVETITACDVVFFATPHGVAHGLADEILQSGTRVIDLSADFRLEDADEWAQWYGQPHGAPHLLADAVYGMPEINREAIKGAHLIAVPGCYPTAVQLGLLPLVEAGLADTKQIIASCASGVSGAGRGVKIGSLFCEAAENMVAYGVGGHRHLPEIRQGLSRAADAPVGLTFVPHLVPMIRGIHATLYATVVDRSIDLQGLFEKRYQHEPFVDVLPAGVCPQTRSVKG
ncbi:MAG TPA: N-acetyl-gamma-glutamyl-phosphate reductase, partial [Gammaproteobacteria bacterium]|nr:N-acetyl-gamma-glutamyl-phosphate reductase [Gammaproteobacteria bacterium]